MRARETRLLHLADDILLEILDRIQDLSSIIRFGALNKRLHRLHFLARRISTSIEPGEPGDGRLLRFLTSLAHNGGCLQELKVRSLGYQDRAQHRDASVLASVSLGWIEPVAAHLRSFELDYRRWDQVDRFAEILTRSTLLVKLRVAVQGRGSFLSQVAQVVACCPSLRVLEICLSSFGDGEVMELTSASLEEIELAVGVNATLHTPALRRLEISAWSLKVRSHSLKRLKLDARPLELIKGISPPPADLDFLWLSELVDLRGVLRRIKGGCVKVLHIEDLDDLDFSADLVTSLQSLTRLRSLEIGSQSLKAFASGTNPERAAQLLARLGVEEMVVELGDMLVGWIDPVEAHLRSFDVVRDWELLLGGLLSSSSPLRKLVVERYSVDVVTEEQIIIDHERRVQELISYLLEQFPGVVSVVDRMTSSCFSQFLSQWLTP